MISVSVGPLDYSGVVSCEFRFSKKDDPMYVLLSGFVCTSRSNDIRAIGILHIKYIAGMQSCAIFPRPGLWDPQGGCSGLPNSKTMAGVFVFSEG